MNDNYRRSERIVNKCQQRDAIKHQTVVKQTVPKRSKQNIETKIRQKIVCDKCGSDGGRDAKNKVKKKTNPLKLKTHFDLVLQQTLNICNCCLKRINRLKNFNDKQKKSSNEDQKQKYLSNCQSFGLSLVQLLNDSSAERLFCPNLMSSGKACACLQRYIIGSDHNLEDKQRRAQHLLDLLKKAKQLSHQKCYSLSNPRSGQKIGLGNGHKKSKEFEIFVFNERNRLRNELKFCEKAVQRVLFYSNNFLHKKLRTEPNGRQRVERQKGKAVTGKLIAIESLSDQTCCTKKCTQLAKTHPQLLDEWRQRAASGQQEARRVLAEMLTPTQASRTNCFTFVSLITGSSMRTICKVNDHLVSNGGNREPIEHGLKKSWFVTDNNKIANDILNQSLSELIQSTSSCDNVRRIQTLPAIERRIDSNQTETRNNLYVNQTNEISVINTGTRLSTPLLTQL